MFTQTSFSHPRFVKKIRRTIWLCQLEAMKTNKRITGYVKNRHNQNVVRIDIYIHPNGNMVSYVSGMGSKDYTSIIVQALDNV